MTRRGIVLAAATAALYVAGFSFTWYALDTGNWLAAVAVLAYLLLVLAALLVALRRRTR